MKSLVLGGTLAAAALVAGAKIPAPVLDDAAKAKAAETAAKAAWQAKIDAWQLCKSQDKVAAAYAKSSGKAVPAAAKAPASAAKPAATAASAAAMAKAPASAASAPATTPVVYSSPPPCIDPGAFAYNPPEQKPLETAGAHSPTGTAASPPSVKAESAAMAPAAKSASAKK